MRSAQATLATDPVPYMGWNTYYGVGGRFNEATVKSVASSLTGGYHLAWAIGAALVVAALGLAITVLRSAPAVAEQAAEPENELQAVYSEAA